MGKEEKDCHLGVLFFSNFFFKDCWTQQESKHQAQKLIFITLAPLEEEDRAQNLDVLDKSRLDPQ